MQRGNSHREIAIANLLEPRRADHVGEPVLIRKPADRFDEVLVAFGIVCDQLAHFRDDVEGIEVIGLLHQLVGQLGKLQHHEPPARAQHPEGFGQGVWDAGDITDAETDRVDIETVAVEGQGHCIANHPVQFVGHGLGLGALLTLDQHRFGHVADRGLGPRSPLEETECDVAGPASHVEQCLPITWGQPVHHRIFPDPMDSNGHDIVHDVIFRRHVGKDAMDHSGLFTLGDRLEAEMRGCAVAIWFVTGHGVLCSVKLTPFYRGL